MTAAYILGINMFVAAIFAVAFGVVAASNRSALGARWMAAGYALGIVDIGLEIGLHWQSDPTPFTISIFLVFLAATTLCLIGVAIHYRSPPPRAAISAIWIASLLAIPLIFTLPYGSALRALLYQSPYVAAQVLISWVILRSRSRQPLDLLLAALSGVTALTYLAKPAIAMAVGSAAAPQSYMTTTYAAISQSIGSVTLIALALILLLVMMRDTTAEMIAQSETDPLSGVLNRRGFEAHAVRLLTAARQANQHVVLVTADLDHFKSVNDEFGHAAGDGVIAHFARLLSDAADEHAIIARLGGEEFAVLLPQATVVQGRRYAEAVRTTLAAAPLNALVHKRMVTASFGVAQKAPEDSLFDLLRRSDIALYKAKRAGRNKVCLSLMEWPASPIRASAGR
jgi:diguanylate cyclase (GGDEF)-like protein